MQPLVSILIPAYNAEPWLEETIRSALGQTWPGKEIIVVDDGSTDGTLSMAQEFASKQVRVLTQTNQGAAATRNRAFSECQGDYIQWLDADDLLAPDKVELQVEALRECQTTRSLFSGSWGTFYHRIGKTNFSPSPLWCDLSPVEWLLRKMGQGCYMQTATWLVSRELTEAAGPWDTRLYSDDDGEYFGRVLVASAGTKFVPEAKVYYRSTAFNTLSYVGLSTKKQDALFLGMKLQIAQLRCLEESERTRAACLKYLQKYVFDFYPERPDIIQQIEKLAGELGGSLRPPEVSSKYAWIHTLFGPRAAKWAQLFLPGLKHRVRRHWDRALHRLEHRKIGSA